MSPAAIPRAASPPPTPSKRTITRDNHHQTPATIVAYRVKPTTSLLPARTRAVRNNHGSPVGRLLCAQLQMREPTSSKLLSVMRDA